MGQLTSKRVMTVGIIVVVIVEEVVDTRDKDLPW